MIDLSATTDDFSDEERMVRDAAQDYCARDPEYKRIRDIRGQTPSFDKEAWRELAEMGWLGSRTPEDLGGMPLTQSQFALLLEEFGKSLAPEPLIAAVVLAGGVLRDSANADLRDRLLPRLIAGEWTPSLAWQESPNAYVAEPSVTKVVTRAGGYVLHGRKCFVPVAEVADAFIISAVGPNGCGLYLAPRDAPGLAITSHARIDGGTWSDLTFDGVQVDADSLIADGDAATAVLERVLDEGRLAVSAELLGLMSRALEMTVEYISMRKQFGKLIGSFQALQHRASDMLLQVELSRAVVRQSANCFDETEDAAARAVAASQAKARCSDAALQIAKDSVQMHGGIGFTDECNIGLFLKRAMVWASWLGGAEAHRQRYGKLVEDTAATGDDNSPNAFRREVRDFVETSFPSEWRFPKVRMSVRETQLWQDRLAEKGWMAPGWPKEYGGMGLSAFDQLAMSEEFDRYGIWISTNFGVTMLGPLLIRYGSEEQKAKYLPEILSGRVRWCQGYSEPGAGSDLASLRTRAELDSDEFVVNGQKTWTSFAHEGDMIFLLVRTDPDAKKQEGISFLLVDMKSPGITVRRIRNIVGGEEFCEVFFDDVRVPRDNLVGEMNRGWTMAKSLLGSERIFVGHTRVARAPLELLHGLLKSRGLLSDPVICARYDTLQLEVDDQAALYIRYINVLRRGGQLGAEVSLLKVWVSEVLQRITDLMLEAGGEEATLNEVVALHDGVQSNLANQYLVSRPATIYGGSSEIQRNIIAKALLELPS